MGKTLSSSPAWVKASWISWKNSGSRDGATVATAWRRAGSDRAGIGINGSSPCGYSAVIPARLLSRPQQNKPCHPSRRDPSGVTLCSYYPAAMLRRGPARGPSNSCTRCNLSHWRQDFVVSVQVAHSDRRAWLLIIRRSWVRAPPAPPDGQVSVVQPLLATELVFMLYCTWSGNQDRAR